MDRVSSIDDAVAQIEDGSTITIGGFGTKHSFPTSLIIALHKHGARDLTLVGNSLGTGPQSCEALLEAGQVRKLIVSFSARAGMESVAEKMIASGEVELELVPQGILVDRVRAAGAGFAAFYSPTAVGTPLGVGKEVRVFDGREYVLEEAIKADYAFVRAHRADRSGNIEFRGASENFNPAFGRAAKITIVEADEIVEVGEIDPQRVGLPAIFVAHVVASSTRIVPDIMDAQRRPSTSRREYLGKPALNRSEMAARVAREIHDGAYVNLGAGMPGLVAAELSGRDIRMHAENGVLGYGPRVATEAEVDSDLFDANGAFISAQPGMSFFDSITSFEIARSGKLDYVVLGGYQVDAHASLANWSNPNQVGGGVGGAMDLVAGARNLIVMMEQCDKAGNSKLVPECTYPLTGLNCVKLIMTDVGLFRFVDGGWRLEEVAPGFTAEDVAQLTGFPVQVAPELVTV